ncbi:hypothetical protein C5167_048742 [Papaver somniferum]|uniref:Uncharacterized protein n=1 Tax=Papaver somniferum TaxID=3469 RepID=A0A4Y7KIU1_PAPSO|nr:hypothetical protein C5167_048742 [Papaver somniferum]
MDRFRAITYSWRKHQLQGRIEEGKRLKSIVDFMKRMPILELNYEFICTSNTRSRSIKQGNTCVVWSSWVYQGKKALQPELNLGWKINEDGHCHSNQQFE